MLIIRNESKDKIKTDVSKNGYQMKIAKQCSLSGELYI